MRELSKKITLEIRSKQLEIKANCSYSKSKLFLLNLKAKILQFISFKTYTLSLKIMSEKQTSLLRFFGKRSVPFQESDVKDEGPTTSKKRKASFNRQYKESYLKYGFISTSDSAAPSPLCLICNSKLSNEAMKTFKTTSAHENKAPRIKR